MVNWADDRALYENMITMIEVSLLVAALLVFPLNTVSANPPSYEVGGTIGGYETDYHWILDVQANDAVLISIAPDAYGYYDSAVFLPNLTQVRSHHGAGTHAYELIAGETGDYLLKISTSGSGFNYDVRSSHEIPSGDVLQATPYNATGEVEGYDTAWHTAYDVKKNEVLLVSIAPDAYGYYDSAVFLPNLTQVKSHHGAGTHAYELIAGETGDYLLKIWTRGFGFNYAIKCSHSMTRPVPVPDFSLTLTRDTLTVEIGSSNYTMVAVHSHGGYTSNVLLNASGVPPGVSVVFDPILVSLPADGKATSIATVNAGLSAKLGTAVVNIIGESGNLSRSCAVSLTIGEVQRKSASSISCHLNASRITYAQDVLISALLDPSLSTGTTRIQSSADNLTWNDLVVRAPQWGQCDFVWTPNAGAHFIRAEWSGDYNHLPCISSMRKLVVDKASTTLGVALSSNTTEPGEEVIVRVTISPSLSEQNVLLQYSTTKETWQNLASGLTDKAGSFRYVWLPERHEILWIRSTWSGSDNYNPCSSEPMMLIASTGRPTRIEIGNATLEVECKENAIVMYDVVDINSNVIRKGTETLDTSSLGTFDLSIVFLGNETYGSCFYNTRYTVTPIATRIDNARIISEYNPNLVELLFEWLENLRGTYTENRAYVGSSARVAFDVQEAKSGALIRNCSQTLDTSKVGYNQVDLTYEGDATHAAAAKILRYRVIDRASPVAYVSVVITVITALSSLAAYVRAKTKKRREGTKTEKPNNLNTSKQND